MKRDDRDRPTEFREGILVDTDETEAGIVWVAGSSTVALMAATVIAAVAGFTTPAVMAIGMVAICCALLTIAAVEHFPRYAGPLPLIEDEGEAHR